MRFTICVAVTLFIGLNTTILHADACGCQCQANHCEAGIPEHLQCSTRSPEEKARIESYRKELLSAVESAINGQTECNFLTQDIAHKWGYDGFEGKQANDIHDMFFKNGGFKRQHDAGWQAFNQNGRPLRIEDAMRYAEAGALVIGVARSDRLARFSGAQHEHGHVMVIVGKNPDSNYENGRGFQKTIVADAGNGRVAGKRRASVAFSEDQEPAVMFFALPARFKAR